LNFYSEKLPSFANAPHTRLCHEMTPWTFLCFVNRILTKETTHNAHLMTGSEDAKYLADVLNSAESGLGLNDAQKKLLADRADDLNTLANSQIFEDITKTMNAVQGASVEQLAAVLSVANQQEAKKVVDAFKRVHDALDTVLDDRFGLSVSETLRFKSALAKAAVSRNISAETKPSGPYGSEPSALTTALATSIPNELEVNTSDLLGPGLVAYVQQEVADGNLQQDVADAILVVYSSRLISALGIEAMAKKDMKEAEMTAVIEKTNSTDEEIQQAVWAMKTLQQLADEQLESVEKPGITASEMMALREAIYGFETESESSEQQDASKSAETGIGEPSSQAAKLEKEQEESENAFEALPLWAKSLIGVGIVVVLLALIIGIVAITTPKMPQPSGSYSLPPQQQPQFGQGQQYFGPQA